jgi:hypothetical protein
MASFQLVIKVKAKDAQAILGSANQILIHRMCIGHLQSQTDLIQI